MIELLDSTAATKFSFATCQATNVSLLVDQFGMHWRHTAVARSALNAGLKTTYLGMDNNLSRARL
jgi:hypothetical protein